MPCQGNCIMDKIALCIIESCDVIFTYSQGNYHCIYCIMDKIALCIIIIIESCSHTHALLGKITTH